LSVDVIKAGFYVPVGLLVNIFSGMIGVAYYRYTACYFLTPDKSPYQIIPAMNEAVAIGMRKGECLSQSVILL